MPVTVVGDAQACGTVSEHVTDEGPPTAGDRSSLAGMRLTELLDEVQDRLRAVART
ncbi:MAG: hypothetical protein JWP33_1987, partial [Blastococcus sp.]|nr:hypothetical protein [Blastococcus sp.]